MFVSDVCCTYVICMFHMFIYMLQVTCPNVAYACSAFFSQVSSVFLQVFKMYFASVSTIFNVCCNC
jgi:hypothetical protein